jgi:hypothetical protein
MTDGSDELTCFARAPAAPSSGGRKPVVRSIPGGHTASAAFRPLRRGCLLLVRWCTACTATRRVGSTLTCVVPNPGRRMR